MTHIHWVVRQNKLEIPRDKDEVNKREIHECDGWSHDPDTMVDPLTPKSTHTVEDLDRVPLTITSCHEEDDGWGSDHCHGTVTRDVFLKLKRKSETPQRKPRTHVSTQISMSLPPHPNHTHTHHTNVMGEHATQRSRPSHRHPRRHSKPNPSSGYHRPLPQVVKKTMSWGSTHCHGTVERDVFLKLKQKSEEPQWKTRPYVPTRKSVSHPPYPNHTPTHPTHQPPSHQPRLPYVLPPFPILTLGMWKKNFIILFLTFIPICWVKHIYLITVSVVDIPWHTKWVTSRYVYK